MSKRDLIKKALCLNDVNENDIVSVKTDTITMFSVNLLRILVLLLLNFALQPEMTDNELYNFIMKNFDKILENVVTELKVTLFDFVNLYEEEIADIVELHCRDECLLVLAIKDKVNQKLEKLKE